MSLFKFTPGREMGKVSTMLTGVTTYEKNIFPFYLFLSSFDVMRTFGKPGALTRSHVRVLYNILTFLTSSLKHVFVFTLCKLAN